MKTAFLSGLASIGLLMSCSAGEKEANDKENAGPIPVNIDPAAAKTGHLADMQGSWISDEDDSNSIIVTGSSFRYFTDDALQYEVPIIFVDSCKTRVPDFEGKAFILSGKEKQTCYLFYAVSQDKLSYIESARGRTSRFTRKN
ncbi:hypothetical protein AB1K62_07355 [Parasphingorhabdus sp. JC815]|uniref:hypothetical protein n=1 Tax=Parasphingorhabdus sp. JC815 TaxID=3232140 RepID=UPI00345AA202